jgi:hypothetical protein
MFFVHPVHRSLGEAGSFSDGGSLAKADGNSRAHSHFAKAASPLPRDRSDQSKTTLQFVFVTITGSIYRFGSWHPLYRAPLGKGKPFQSNNSKRIENHQLSTILF